MIYHIGKDEFCPGSMNACGGCTGVSGFTDKIYYTEYEHSAACSDTAKYSSVALVLYLGSPIFVINVLWVVPTNHNEDYRIRT